MGNSSNSIIKRISLVKTTMASTASTNSGMVMNESIHLLAIEAVRIGSRIAQKAQAECSISPTIKHDSSPVTAADFAVQACITYILKQSYPEMKLLAEEDDENFKELSDEVKNKVVSLVSAEIPQVNTIDKVEELICKGSFGKSKEDKPPCFVLDPIDGTKGFLRGEQYAICLGFLEADGKASMGVLGCPNMPKHFFDKDSETADSPRGFLFEARFGQGARIRTLFPANEVEKSLILMNLPNDLKPLATSSDHVIFAESYEKSHMKGELPQVLFKEFDIHDEEKEVLRIDSQVKFAALARGDAHAYFRFVPFDLCIWDVLPGYCLLTEAGGRVTQKRGEPINFLLGRTIKSDNLIATCFGYEEVHERMIQSIARAESNKS
jgi:HAL2 family 3'(2'),5'-bisphosphate nucleotidase